MGMFDGIEQVSSSQGGAWMKEGNHTFKVNALKMPPGLRAGVCFIAELEVVETNCPEYKVGQSVSFVRNITKHKEMALADVKALLAAVARCDEADIDSAGADAAVGEDQPFAGQLVNCEAFNRPTASGGEFTRTVWTQAS